MHTERRVDYSARHGILFEAVFIILFEFLTSICHHKSARIRNAQIL